MDAISMDVDHDDAARGSGDTWAIERGEHALEKALVSDDK
jgi:hypothetical protein